MKKLTNVQKILKALKSGPKTQVDLVRETKVKNVYQIISDLKKKKLVFMDTGKCVNLTVRCLVLNLEWRLTRRQR
jgi:predicted transcriptional regulator